MTYIMPSPDRARGKIDLDRFAADLAQALGGAPIPSNEGDAS